jgi:hypothetical protein
MIHSDNAAGSECLVAGRWFYRSEIINKSMKRLIFSNERLRSDADKLGESLSSGFGTKYLSGSELFSSSGVEPFHPLANRCAVQFWGLGWNGCITRAHQIQFGTQPVNLGSLVVRIGR